MSALNAPPTELEPVSWGPVRYIRLYSVCLGIAVASLVAIAAVAILAVPAIVSDGISPSTVLLVGVLFLVGGPASALYLISGYRNVSSQRQREIRQWIRQHISGVSTLSPLWVTIGGSGILILTWGVLDAPWLLISGSPLTVGLLLGIVFFAGTGTTYTIDPNPDKPVCTVSTATRDRSNTRRLDGLCGFRRISTPCCVLFLLRSRGSAWIASPYLFVVPHATADAVEAALATIVETNTVERADRVTRGILFVLGALFLFLLGGIWLLTNEVFVLFLLGSILGLFGVLLIVLSFRI